MIKELIRRTDVAQCLFQDVLFTTQMKIGLPYNGNSCVSCISIHCCMGLWSEMTSKSAEVKL